MRILVLPDTKIGHAAVVGSGSVVTKDVPDFGIVRGNPARLIGERAWLDFSYNPALAQWV